MAEAAAAVAEATPAPAAAEPATEATAFVDPVDGAFERIANEVEQSEGAEDGPVTEPAPPPDEAEPKKEPDPKAAAEALAAADEALFTDKALSTPAGLKAAAQRARELRTEATTTLKKAEKQQRQNDRDFIVLKKKQESFKTDKAEFLSWRAGEQNTLRMLGGHLEVVASSNDPKQILDSLGFLTRRDGRAMYELIVAGGAAMRKQPSPEIEELRRELREEREERKREREEARQAADRQQKNEVVQRREGEILAAAKDATAYPTLARYVEIRPREVLAEIITLKRAHREATEQTLSDAEAMLQLDQQLALLLEGQRGGAGNPRAEPASNPGGQPSQSSPARLPSLVAGIPPSASTRVPTQREPTEEERRQDYTPEFLRDIGLW